MKAKIIIIILLACSYLNELNGQPDYFRIESISNKDYYSFPVFRSEKRIDSVSDEINLHLQLDLFYLRDYEFEPSFEGRNFSYKIFSNTSKILSLQIKETLCGEDCEWLFNNYTFNAANGDRIQLSDIFTNIGYDTICAMIIMKCKENFIAQILKLEYAERKQYQTFNCYDSFEFSQFYILGNSLFIDGGHCLSSQQRESKLNMVIEFKLEEFLGYLNDYGLALFGDSKTLIDQYRSNSLPQIFDGTIGSSNQKTVFIIKIDNEGWVKAKYVQLKTNATKHYLSGKLSGDNLILNETDETGRSIAYINATYKQGLIKGKWTSRDKRESLNFNFMRR